MADDDPRPIVPPCRGWCRGERAHTDGPARLSAVRTPGGRRIPVCECCSKPLRQAASGDRVDAMAQGRLPPGARAEDAFLWVDDACGYDIVSMRDLVQA
jgi:hypothetical protein